MRYNTIGGAGEPASASAAIIRPSGGGVSCSGSRPVLLYAHSTSVEKSSPAMCARRWPTIPTSTPSSRAPPCIYEAPYAATIEAGSGDPTGPYLNAVSAGAYFHARPNPGELVEIDLDDTPGRNDHYRIYKLSFIAAKVALRAPAIEQGDSPDQAVETNYHAGLVAPFCIAASRDFF